MIFRGAIKTMRKTALLALCVLLLCGGLFCLHLTAQPGNLNAALEKEYSLIDLKIDETSERELLELKVASRQKIADSITVEYKAAAPRGALNRMMQAHANLAAAKVELYQHTGEREKLFIALEEKVSALTDNLRNAIIQHSMGVTTQDAVLEAEIQLLDAMLELKRERNANKR